MFFIKEINKDLKGIIYICLASLFFSLMSTFVKLCSNNLNLIEIIFLRSIIATIILTPFIFFLKIRIQTNLFAKHFIRTAIGIIAMFLNFYALSKLPLSNYTIISFAKIFFILPLAFLFLKERIKIFSFYYIVLGFSGIIIILGFEDNQKTLFPYYLISIFATLLIAYIKIFLKNIAKVENNFSIQFFFSLISAALLLIPFILSNPKLVFNDIIFTTLLSIFGLLAQYFTVEGLKSSDAVKVMPFDFSRIIFSIMIGFGFFNEKITFSMIVGTLIIFLAGIKLIKINPSN